MARRNPNTPPIDSHGATPRPTQDRVLVRRLPVPAFAPGGGLIIRPEHRDMKSDRGRVLAVGPGKPLPDGGVRRLDVAVGDIVVFPLYQPIVVTIDGEELLIMREDDLSGVEDPENLSEEAKAGLAAEEHDGLRPAGIGSVRAA